MTELYFYINNVKYSLTTQNILGQGGEGIIYDTNHNNIVAKLYHNPSIDKLNKIIYMANHLPHSSENSILAWPLAPLFDNLNNFKGYVMKKALPNSTQLYNITKPKINLTEFKHLSPSNPNNTELKYKLLVNIINALKPLLDNPNYVIVDCKPQNILIDKNLNVSILDLDSIQIIVENNCFYASVITPEYTPKHYIDKIPTKTIYDKYTDNFAIAVITYQLLFNIHPFVSKAKNNNIVSISDLIYYELLPFGKYIQDIEDFPPLHNKFFDAPITIQKLITDVLVNKLTISTAEWVNVFSSLSTQSDIIEENIHQTNIPEQHLTALRETIKTFKTIKNCLDNIKDNTLQTKQKFALKIIYCFSYEYIQYINTDEYENLKYITDITNAIFKDDNSIHMDNKLFTSIYKLKSYNLRNDELIRLIHNTIKTNSKLTQDSTLFKKFSMNPNNFIVFDTTEKLNNIISKVDYVINIPAMIGSINLAFFNKFNNIDVEDSDYLY